MGYHGNSKILLPWGVPIHHVFYSVFDDEDDNGNVDIRKPKRKKRKVTC